MKATHKLIFKADGTTFYTHSIGDTYWCEDPTRGTWNGPYSGFNHYTKSNDWLVEKINTLKGNK